MPITDFKDLDLKPEDTKEIFAQKIESKLDIKLDSLKDILNTKLHNKADELSTEFPNIAPKGDYSNLLEDNEGMAKFLREIATTTEHWEPKSVASSDYGLIQIQFSNSSVDDGDSLFGYIFVSKAGKVRHSFVQYED